MAVHIAHDCTDGFGKAYYARPEAFLDPEVAAVQPRWAFTDEAAVRRGIQLLAADLASGAWDERHGHLRDQITRGPAPVHLIIARPPEVHRPGTGRPPPPGA